MTLTSLITCAICYLDTSKGLFTNNTMVFSSLNGQLAIMLEGNKPKSIMKIFFRYCNGFN